MKTPYDWITILIFSGLVVLFLHRSDQPATAHDSLVLYLLAGGGCAVTNWLGNEGYHPAAIAAGLCLVAFILIVLKPFSRPPQP